MLGNFISLAFFSMILFTVLFRKYKYDTFKSILMDAFLDRKIDKKAFKVYTSRFNRLSFFFFFPDERKEKELYRDLRFIRFKKKVKLLEWINLSYIVLVLLVMTVLSYYDLI